MATLSGALETFVEEGHVFGYALGGHIGAAADLHTFMEGESESADSKFTQLTSL